MTSAAAPILEKKSFKQLAKEKKGKIVLVSIMALVALYMWSGIMFGNKDGGRPTRDEAMASLDNPVQPPGAPAPKAAAATPAKSAPVANSSAPAPDAATASPSILGPIRSFDAAMARIQTWEEPLSEHLEREALTTEIDELFPPSTGFFEEEIVVEGHFSDLVLSGTALFGDSKYAVVNDKRLQEGDRISRYVVKEIRAREIVLTEADQTHVLRMAEPRLKSRTKRSSNLEDLNP